MDAAHFIIPQYCKTTVQQGLNKTYSCTSNFYWDYCLKHNSMEEHTKKTAH